MPDFLRRISESDLKIATAVALAFVSPKRRDAPSCSNDVDLGQRRVLRRGSTKLAVRRVGTGPAVVFVHGWEGSANDFASLTRTATENDFSAIHVELPAHGENLGETACIPEIGESLLALRDAFHGIHALVCHSAGGLAGLYAAHQGLEAGRFVLISIPARYEDYIRRFAMQRGLNPEQTEAVTHILDRMGARVKFIQAPLLARSMKSPALIIHSADDRVVPIADAVETAEAWPGAQIMTVQQAGHRRILHDPPVISAIMRFLKRQF